MATKTKKPATRKIAKKAAPKKAAKPKINTAPVADPCTKGHKWDTDAEGVEHCTVCLADRKVIEKPSKKKARPTETKLSALDAAAKVLAGSAEPLNTKQMIEQMAAKKLWTSPGGKTPHATLYSALLREIQTKGKEARFKKTERGHFAVNG